MKESEERSRDHYLRAGQEELRARWTLHDTLCPALGSHRWPGWDIAVQRLVRRLMVLAIAAYLGVVSAGLIAGFTVSVPWTIAAHILPRCSGSRVAHASSMRVQARRSLQIERRERA